MTSAGSMVAQQTQETWEIVVPGGVNVWKVNKRTGEYELTRVHGTSGPKLLRLTTDERKYNQEIIPEENKGIDPFTNGSLVQVVDGKRVGITEDLLGEYLELTTEETFAEALATLAENELSVRRLLSLAEKSGQMWQVEMLRELIEERYKVGGTQPTVQEMLEEGDNKGEQLS